MSYKEAMKALATIMEADSTVPDTLVLWPWGSIRLIEKAAEEEGMSPEDYLKELENPGLERFYYERKSDPMVPMADKNGKAIKPTSKLKGPEGEIPAFAPVPLRRTR